MRMSRRAAAGSSVDYALALEEARRDFDALSAELPALRSRAIQTAGIGGLALSFLGGLAIRTGEPLSGWAYVAVAAFVVMTTLCLVILWPRRLYSSVDPAVLVEWAERADATSENMRRDLALQMGLKYEHNRVKIDRLSWMGCAIVVALFVQIAALVTALSRT